MSDGNMNASAMARRYYLHVSNGGKLKPDDVSRMVQAIERLEGQIITDSADAIPNAAYVAGLRDALRDAGALRDAADHVSEWFCNDARHLEGPRIQGLRMAMVAYDRHMQPNPDAKPQAAHDLSDPIAVHANMLRGSIAKPTIAQIIHIYGVDALCAALVPKIVREAEEQAAPVRVVTVAQLENVEQELSNRVADFPRYTCSDIDAAIWAVGPLVKQAYAMEDNEFAQEFWSACSSLPSDLDDLRNANSQLRESLLEALKSRKDMAEEIRAIIGCQP